MVWVSLCSEKAHIPVLLRFLVMLLLHADLPFQKMPPLPLENGNWQRNREGPIYAFAILREVEITRQRGVMRSLK